MQKKKRVEIGVNITDGQKVGRVLTVKRTAQNMFIIFGYKGGIHKHFTYPPNGCIHMTTYSNKDKRPYHEFWVPNEDPYAYGVEFRASDPSTWGDEPRENADETVCFDIRSHVGAGKRDVLTVVAMVLKRGMIEPLHAFSSLDVLLCHVTKHIDDRRLAIVVYTTKEP